MWGHSLFVLGMKRIKPQKMEKTFLRYALSITRSMQREDFALGFNGIGAWSSVNHFHLQGLFFPEVKGEAATNNFPIMIQAREEVFRFGEVIVHWLPDWPMICYAVQLKNGHDSDHGVHELIDTVWGLLELLQTRETPYNLLIVDAVVFIFPRQRQRENGVGLFADCQDAGTPEVHSGRLRVAVAELSGLVIAGDKVAYKNLTEEMYVTIMQTEVSLAAVRSLYMVQRLAVKSPNSFKSERSSGQSTREFKPRIETHWVAASGAMGSGYSICSGDNPRLDPKVLSVKHFEIHRIVGQGGFGKVNAVIRKKTQPVKWLAMKTLSKAVVVNKNCVNMIWNERNLLTQLQSPLVVRMHHTFQDAYNCYVVMDLLLGGDLKYHLNFTRKNGFTEDEAKFYVAGVLLSLEYLHDRSILHRDVKPENVILDEKGYPRLTDLGISVQTTTLRYQSRSGTVSYMAPELFRGSTDHGVPSDFFCLGVLAYELLLTKRPWSGGVRAHLETCPNVMKEFPESAYDSYYPVDLLDSYSSGKLSKSCRSFVRRLLHPMELQRLGSGTNGALDVKNHEWLEGFDWQGYLAQALKPPFVPVVDEGKANCDTAAQDFDDVLDLNSRPTERISAEDQKQFLGFEFNIDVDNPVAM
ncbi:hypothetical protein BBJ28_00011498 [Nothophytophthora sp. Chile5]|nr:hypothetical protein BBJ28_00011498 [Nothophytophthora sp. Chile5]